MDPTLRSTFAAEVRSSASETITKLLCMCACQGGWSTTGMSPTTQVYAADLGHSEAPDDQRLGFAEQMVKGLFWHWAQKTEHATSDSRPVLDPHRCCIWGPADLMQVNGIANTGRGVPSSLQQC